MGIISILIKKFLNIFNSSSSSSSSSSSVGATARCGLWPVEQYLSIFPYPSPILSIFSLPALEDLFLLLLSHPFLGLPFRLVPFQFLSEDLFGHPILLHSLQVTQPTYPLLLYPFYYIFSFTQLFQFSTRPTFPFPIFIFSTTYSYKHVPLKNKQSLFFFLRHRECFRSICYYRSYYCLI